uniref:Uncharacterized protein n=1 Tax=viral metagenome TaxID=1070528 RepID=A0A6H1ZKE1_9ZZZZ
MPEEESYGDFKRRMIREKGIKLIEESKDVKIIEEERKGLSYEGIYAIKTGKKIKKFRFQPYGSPGETIEVLGDEIVQLGIREEASGDGIAGDTLIFKLPKEFDIIVIALGDD